MKRKKRYPRVLVTLLLLVAIVLIILLFRHIAANETINTKLFKTHPGAVTAVAPADVQQVVPEAQPAETPAPTEAAPAETPAPVEEPVAEAPAVSGTVVDTGIIRTICPDGWMNIQLTDVFAEKDEEGNYPLDPTRIGLCKGGTSQADALSKLTVYIYYQSGALSDSTIENSAIWFSETEDITVTINGVEYKGFHAKDESLFNEGEFYEYDNLFIPADDSHNIQFQVLCSAPGIDETLSLDDPEVQTIISNFALD